MITILETENKDWGFWGTGKNYLKRKKDITKLWNETAKLIQKNSGLAPEETQKLMDSRWGRHTADSYMEEISTNVETFIKTADRRLTKDRLIEDYRHYVDEHAYPNPIPQKYHDFCKELEKLSRKYGIVIHALKARPFIMHGNSVPDHVISELYQVPEIICHRSGLHRAGVHDAAGTGSAPASPELDR